MTTWIDGIQTDQLPADDRGLRYADGVFETMAVRGGRLIAFERHYKRLVRGCKAFGLPVPSRASLEVDVQAMTLPDKAVARLTVTRGSGGRGYAPPASPTARRIWELLGWPGVDPAMYHDGIRVAWLDTKLAPQPPLAGIKHLGRAEQVLAARELSVVDADDGLLCDIWGQVIEAVSANVFSRVGDTLSTPDLDQCGVAGVMRERVLAHASSLGFRTRVISLRPADLVMANEVFLTSSIRGVVPVRKLGALRLADFRAACAFQQRFKARDEVSP